jgi:hypothetical protein
MTRFIVSTESSLSVLLRGISAVKYVPMFMSVEQHHIWSGAVKRLDSAVASLGFSAVGCHSRSAWYRDWPVESTNLFLHPSIQLPISTSVGWRRSRWSVTDGQMKAWNDHELNLLTWSHTSSDQLRVVRYFALHYCRSKKVLLVNSDQVIQCFETEQNYVVLLVKAAR